MCVVSAVTNFYQREWGSPWIDPGYKPPIVESVKIITDAQWEEYQRLKRAAEEIDKKTSQPDCIKPDLAEWEQKMEEFLIKKGVLK